LKPSLLSVFRGQKIYSLECTKKLFLKNIRIVYLVCQEKIIQHIVMHSYGIIGRIIEANAIAYIVNSIKNQKGKPQREDLPLLKNDIANILGPQKPVVYSRKYRS